MNSQRHSYPLSEAKTSISSSLLTPPHTSSEQGADSLKESLETETLGRLITEDHSNHVSSRFIFYARVNWRSHNGVNSDLAWQEASILKLHRLTQWLDIHTMIRRGTPSIVPRRKEIEILSSVASLVELVNHRLKLFRKSIQVSTSSGEPILTRVFAGIQGLLV